MGFSLFGSKKEDSADSNNIWSSLSTLEELEGIMLRSESNPQIIFKHSTRCGISRVVLRNFEAEWSLTDQKGNLHLLDLIQFREISNKIAELTGVQHQSPQLIYIHKGSVTVHRSHQAIEAQEVIELLRS